MWIVITNTVGNRPASVLEFDDQASADQYVIDNGGIAYDLPVGTPVDDLWIDSGVVTVVPVVVDWDALDTEILDRMLLEDGSPLRAVAELFLQDRNSMASAVANATSLADLKANFPPVYTVQQYKDALKAKMRS